MGISSTVADKSFCIQHLKGRHGKDRQSNSRGRLVRQTYSLDRQQGAAFSTCFPCYWDHQSLVFVGAVEASSFSDWAGAIKSLFSLLAAGFIERHILGLTLLRLGHDIDAWGCSGF